MYIKWGTHIPDMHEFILNHILPQTVQWKQNPRVHTRIHSLALGVKSTGKGGQQLVGASMGWEKAETTNRLLAFLPVLPFYSSSLHILTMAKLKWTHRIACTNTDFLFLGDYDYA